MARITVEKCLEHVPSRFDLILLASGRARQLSTTSREPMVETNNDKNTLIALKDSNFNLSFLSIACFRSMLIFSINDMV